MSLDIDSMGSGDIAPIDEGNLPAVIVGLATYGIQPQTDYKTGEPKPSEKRLALTFEFPTEAIEKEEEDGTVRIIARRLTKEYKVSSHKKSNIMKLIRTVAPDIENLKQLLGMGCSVTVGRTSTGKAKVADVTSLMKGIPKPEPLEGVNAFDFYDPDEASFKRLSKWQQDVVVSAEDYNGFADEWVDNEEEAY